MRAYIKTWPSLDVMCTSYGSWVSSKTKRGPYEERMEALVCTGGGWVRMEIELGKTQLHGTGECQGPPASARVRASRTPLRILPGGPCNLLQADFGLIQN